MTTFQYSFLFDKYRNLNTLLSKFLLILLLMLAITTSVAAHSELVKSEPEAGASLENSPAQVTTWFSEELDSEMSSMRVFDAQNNQVDNGDGSVDLNDLDHLSMVVSLPPLPAGTYRVHWTSVSAEDGDAEEGEFTFNVTVGAASGETSSPSGNSSLIWVISIAAVLIVLAVLAMIAVSRRMGSSQ